MKSFELSSQSFEGNTFDGGRFSSVSISECEFRACTFDRIKSKSVSLGGGSKQSKYVECTFKNCEFSFFALGNVLFDQCSFENCRLSNLFSVAGEFVDCNFAGTAIKKGSLSGKVPEDLAGSYRRRINQIERNDFTRATLVDVDFRGGVNLLESQFPALTECVFVSDTCVAAKRLAAEGGGRVLQKLLEHYCKDGQRQQLIYLPLSESERIVLTSVLAA
jgi:uncharacterized protein YjbI with pentapeptide repeats